MLKLSQPYILKIVLLFIGFNIFYVVVISTRAHVCHSLVPGNICISFCVITRKYIKLLVSYIQFNLL